MRGRMGDARGAGSSRSRPSTNACWKAWRDLAAEGFEPVRAAGASRTGCSTRPCCADALRRADAAGQRHGGEQRDRRDPGHRRARGASRTRPARCSTPTRRRRRARSRSTWRPASTCSASAATSCTGRRASARSTSAGGRGCGSRRCSPAAGRSAGCAPARCRRRWSSGLGEACRIARGGDGGRGRRASPRCATRLLAPAARRGPGLRINGSLSAPHRRQSQPDLPGAARSALMRAVAGSVRLHRLGLPLGRDRAELRAARASGLTTTRRRAPCASGWDALPRAADVDFAADALADAQLAARDHGRSRSLACRR